MKLHDPQRPVINPRQLVETEGPDALAELMLREARYAIQRRPLLDLTEALRSFQPLFAQGARGGGKTTLAKALASACNLPYFFFQGNDSTTKEEILYQWNEEAQKDHQRKLVGGGTDHARANAEVWTRKFLILGDALQAYDFARRQQIAPLLLLDEFEKTRPAVEYYFYQLFTDGGINVPRLMEDEGYLGLRALEDPADRQLLPIVVITSNGMREVSEPLLSRCNFTYIPPPTLKEEIIVLRTACPEAPQTLVKAVVKLNNYIRTGMTNVVSKPGPRESIALLSALHRKGMTTLDMELIDGHLSYIARTPNDLHNLVKGLGPMEQQALGTHRFVDSLVEQAFTQDLLTIRG